MKKKTVTVKDLDFKKIKSIDDAIKSLPEDDQDVVFYNKLKTMGAPDYALAHLEMIIITKAVNPKDFIPDFDNWDQYKWCPWFRGGRSGFGFSYSGCAATYSGTHLGSLLCFYDKDRADYCGKTFESIYKRYLIK